MDAERSENLLIKIYKNRSKQRCPNIVRACKYVGLISGNLLPREPLSPTGRMYAVGAPIHHLQKFRSHRCGPNYLKNAA